MKKKHFHSLEVICSKRQSVTNMSFHTHYILIREILSFASNNNKEKKAKLMQELKGKEKKFSVLKNCPPSTVFITTAISKNIPPDLQMVP